MAIVIVTKSQPLRIVFSEGNMKRFIFINAILICSMFTYAQQIEWQGKVELLGTFSSEASNPFWFHANTNTQVGTSSNFSGLGDVEGTYAISENASIKAGLSFFYRDAVTDEFQRKNAFVQFQNNWLSATIGSKSGEIKQQGLSATNKNFLYSENSRPLPGLLLEANNPLKISESFAFDWGIGHFYLNDNRFVEDVMIHYKRLGLQIHFNETNKVTAQIQHYAQWGGTSQEFGKLNSDFEAFVDVFFAKRASEISIEGELLNAVGNHLGSYLLDYSFNASAGDFSIYHEHPFEDGSGTRLANFPDGVWGVYFQPTESKVFSGIVYEFITTNNQSKGGVGADNYFSNSIYRSGWTYEGNAIGLPLILIDPDVEVTAINSPIISNRVISHHFGLTGTVKEVLWQLKSSFVKNLGTYNKPFPEPIRVWYNYLSLQYPTQKYGTFRLLGGVDTGKSIDTVVGVGLGYSYAF